MAHILVRRQQAILRSSAREIHRSTTNNNEQTNLQMTHSVDERLFLCAHDSKRLLNLLTRFASEPQISIYSSPTTQIHERLMKTDENRTFPSSCVKPDLDEINFEDLFLWNCDKNSSNSSIGEIPLESVHLSDDISTLSLNNEIEPVPEQLNMKEDFNKDDNEENNKNNNNNSDERIFRRRKRRSSLTKTSPNIDETNNEIETTSNLLLIDTNNETTKQDEEESNENEPVKTNRFRVRRLRHRLHRSPETSSPSNDQTEPILFQLDEQSNRVSNEESSTPLLEPSTPDLSHPTTPSGGLKRVNSSSANKKNVRFADSVGLELTQVQYIQSNYSEEAKEFSMMLGSSLLSSSPPSFSSNSLYVPSQFNFEHKPWSFDVDLPSKQNGIEKPLPRRFFCLFRQPNSEPAEIYLHEVWKYQIKLEHADIPLHQSSTGEQYLIGTIWVANVGFLKNVSVKYTFNRWLNTYEHEAQHRRHSNDFRNTDLFEFHIDIPVDVDRIDFVLRYSVNGHEYWDNNDGKNYTIQTENNYAPQTKISLPHDCDFNEMRFY